MDVRIAFVAGGISGVTLGYFLAVKRLKHVYAEMLSEEVQRTRDFYEATNKARIDLPPAEEVEIDRTVFEAAQAMVAYQRGPVLEEQKVEKLEGPTTHHEDVKAKLPYIISTNEYASDESRYDTFEITYFAGDGILADENYKIIENIEATVGKDNLTKFGEKSEDKDIVYIRNENLRTDYNVLRDIRSHSETVIEPNQKEETVRKSSPRSYGKKPFIISEDEFMANETDYEQNSLTWYEGDGVLIDQSDSVVERVDDTVGRENLTKFGEKSGDPNIVYVRCDRFNMDFEVARSEGKYSVEVLGLDEGTVAETS